MCDQERAKLPFLEEVSQNFNDKPVDISTVTHSEIQEIIDENRRIQKNLNRANLRIEELTKILLNSKNIEPSKPLTPLTPLTPDGFLQLVTKLLQTDPDPSVRKMCLKLLGMIFLIPEESKDYNWKNNMFSLLQS
jgi:hypothetical protein